MEHLYFLILVLPFLGALTIGLVGFLAPHLRKNEKAIGAFGTLMVGIPFLLIAYAFYDMAFGHGHGEAIEFGLFGGKDSLQWMFGGNLDLHFNYRLDQLSLTMGLIVTGVGSLIHVYSIGYMHGDRGYYKFFLYLNLFIFAMLNLVLGNNLVVLFLGWEGVGACSYFLIGFWYEDMEKAKAAQKAFVANRIGDFALICAMMIIYFTTGTLTIAGEPGSEAILNNLDAITGNYVWVVPLLLFIAATGKSAQIPLYVWLPDAMAGPTPVSALIHAATMVTSGIYLIARMGVMYEAAPGVMMVVAFGGAMTALLAAMIAVAQNDIKKVLAYSTVSQLGFMFMALGAGAFTTAIFHVMTHAFFKACLFLGSGSVIHAMDHMHTVEDGQDVRTMGNLKKYMPATHITFFVSTLAIAGLPFLSGFFSKDEIMTMIFLNGGPYYIIWGIGMLSALLTAFYMTRVYFLTFRGKERFPDSAHPHESPATMTIPLYVLSFLAIVGGYIGLPAIFGHEAHVLNGWLAGHEGHGAVSMHHIHEVEHHAAEHFNMLGLELFLIGFSILIAFAGVIFSWRLYRKHSIHGDVLVQKRLGKFYGLMQNKFYVDEIYQAGIINPFVALGRNVIMAFDRYVIDGLVNGIGNVVLFVGDTLKMLQSGSVGNYALMITFGVILIMSYLILV
ncbi:MAG: NADH-quinone oxidoreductase subunit L [Bacteroidota bacterium]